MNTTTAQTKTALIEMRIRLRSSIKWSTSGIVPVGCGLRRHGIRTAIGPLR